LMNQEVDVVNSQLQLSSALQRIGLLKVQHGDQAGALAAYKEGLEIVRKIVAEPNANPAAQQDLQRFLQSIAGVELMGGDQAGGLSAYEEGASIARKLMAQDHGNAQAQGDMMFNLKGIAYVKLQQNDHAGALAAYLEFNDIYRSLASQDPGNPQTQRQLVEMLGFESGVASLARNYPTALSLAEEAIVLEPNTLSLQIARARALMLLGKTDEARKIYMDYRGKAIQGGTTWEQAIRDDFAALRKAEIKDELMSEIEVAFAKR
jgi:tetratricopeptide (TPR) repeat protein